MGREGYGAPKAVRLLGKPAMKGVGPPNTSNEGREGRTAAMKRGEGPELAAYARYKGETRQ